MKQRLLDASVLVAAALALPVLAVAAVVVVVLAGSDEDPIDGVALDATAEDDTLTLTLTWDGPGELESSTGADVVRSGDHIGVLGGGLPAGPVGRFVPGEGAGSGNDDAYVLAPGGRFVQRFDISPLDPGGYRFQIVSVTADDRDSSVTAEATIPA